MVKCGLLLRLQRPDLRQREAYRLGRPKGCPFLTIVRNPRCLLRKLLIMFCPALKSRGGYPCEQLKSAGERCLLLPGSSGSCSLRLAQWWCLYFCPLPISAYLVTLIPCGSEPKITRIFLVWSLNRSHKRTRIPPRCWIRAMPSYCVSATTLLTHAMRISAFRYA